MSKEEFEAEQLRVEIAQLKKEHERERTEWEMERKELQDTVKIKARVEVIHAEYTQEYFPKAVLLVLSTFDKENKFAHIYTKWMSLINYMLVCGVGVFINMYVLLSFSNFMVLWLANTVAIFTAFLFNWTFSVGPLGYLFGLSPKVRVEKRV